MLWPTLLASVAHDLIFSVRQMANDPAGIWPLLGWDQAPLGGRGVGGEGLTLVLVFRGPGGLPLGECRDLRSKSRSESLYDRLAHFKKQCRLAYGTF